MRPVHSRKKINKPSIIPISLKGILFSPRSRFVIEGVPDFNKPHTGDVFRISRVAKLVAYVILN